MVKATVLFCAVSLTSIMVLFTSGFHQQVYWTRLPVTMVEMQGTVKLVDWEQFTFDFVCVKQNLNKFVLEDWGVP
jgi:hypothetical protein